MQPIYSALADIILIVHALIVFFNIGAFVVIWIGFWRNWHFVRNLYFRVIHLLLMGYVALQTVLGEACPLTVWENALRRKAGQSEYQGTFIGHLLERVLFYEADASTFAVLYTVFFGLIVMTWFAVKPERRKSFLKHQKIES